MLMHTVIVFGPTDLDEKVKTQTSESNSTTAWKAMPLDILGAWNHYILNSYQFLTHKIIKILSASVAQNVKSKMPQYKFHSGSWHVSSFAKRYLFYQWIMNTYKNAPLYKISLHYGEKNIWRERFLSQKTSWKSRLRKDTLRNIKTKF